MTDFRTYSHFSSFTSLLTGELTDVFGANGAEIQFSAFPSTTSLTVILSVVPAGANSVQILYRLWKWQGVDDWTVFETIDNPTAGSTTSTITGLTAGVLYEISARAWSGLGATGVYSIKDNTLRLRPPKGVRMEDVLEAIRTILRSDLPTYLAQVNSKYSDGITLANPLDKRYFIEERRPESVDSAPAVWIFDSGHIKEPFTGTRNLFIHEVMIQVWLISDADQEKFKQKLMRYNEAIHKTLLAYPTLGGVAWRFAQGTPTVEPDFEENYLFTHSELPLSVESFE